MIISEQIKELKILRRIIASLKEHYFGRDYKESKDSSYDKGVRDCLKIIDEYIYM